MAIDELKDRIRGALHAGFEFRSGLDGQTSEHLADAADQHDDLGAAQLLEHLASDVDNLDADVTSSFIALVSEHDHRGSVFLACSLAGDDLLRHILDSINDVIDLVVMPQDRREL